MDERDSGEKGRAFSLLLPHSAPTARMISAAMARKAFLVPAENGLPTKFGWSAFIWPDSTFIRAEC